MFAEVVRFSRGCQNVEVSINTWSAGDIFVIPD